MKYLTFVLCLCLFTPHASALGLNDVSVLLPLPEESELALLLGPQDQGPQGSLLPQEKIKGLPQLLPEFKNDFTYSQLLKALSVRIDPCFIEGHGPLPCRAQVRIIWQPLQSTKDSKVYTRDAALHSFYEFPPETFAALWKQWRELSEAKLENLPLQVHPLIKTQGLSGTYWTRLRQLILNHCGDKNLIRVTAMNVMSGERMWVFAGIDFQNSQSTPISIPRINKNAQGVVINTEGFQHYSGRMIPPPSHNIEMVRFIEDSITFKEKASTEEIQSVMSAALDFENPKKHNPGTLDCVSCHLADQTLVWGQKHLTNLDWNKLFQNLRYQSSWNTFNSTHQVLRTNQLRAFGYFHTSPAISQRVIHETADAFDQLQAAEAHP